MKMNLWKFMSKCPIDDENNAMSSEKGHGNVSKPNMVFDATLWCESKQW